MHLRPLGWQAIDVIANADVLQAKWFRGHRGEASPLSPWQAAAEQVEDFDADVVLLQDVSFFPAHVLARFRQDGRLVAAQCSCPMPPEENLREVEVCFTSFPHYAGENGELRKRGVRRAEYLPLAFEPDVLQRLDEDRHARLDALGRGMRIELPPEERNIPIAFVGGVGKRVHWRAGTEALEAVARRFGPANFHWYGYGREWLDPDSPLLACWRGEAWGLAMYRVYQRARIVVNRHGEVARGYTNCMRTFEATGCGALLLTERSPNLADLFPRGGVVAYDDPAHLLRQIERYLGCEEARVREAAVATETVLAEHTFARRMVRVGEVLMEELA